jgi:hypothetical protein
MSPALQYAIYAMDSYNRGYLSRLAITNGPDLMGATAVEPLRKGFAQPCIKATRMNCQHPAHRPNGKHQPVLGNEGIPHRDSLAKYAVAFFRMSPFAGKTASQVN